MLEARATYKKSIKLEIPVSYGRGGEVPKIKKDDICHY